MVSMRPNVQRGRSRGMTDVLVDQDYPNVLPLCCEPVECGLDRGVVRLGVYHDEVLLVVWRCRDLLSRVLDLGGEGSGVEQLWYARRCQLEAGL
jgi:hypothetical protein